MAAPAEPPPQPIDVLDRLSPDAFAVSLAPLFEGAPRFLARLAAARPFGSYDALFERAREVALAMSEPEQLELIDAHPRLGAPPGSVSALSFLEQGYEREAGVAAEAERAEAERALVAAELERLNAAYEARFGFRYCVFVDRRSRAALLPGMQAALSAQRDAEIRRALLDVVAIAADRLRTLGGPRG